MAKSIAKRNDRYQKSAEVRHRLFVLIIRLTTAIAPVKNWGGVGVIDFPERAGIHHDVFAARVDKEHGCWHCPIACKATLKAGEGEYKYAAGCPSAGV